MGNYPSQDEALDWANASNKINTGSCEISNEARSKFDQADQIRHDEFKRIFSDESPWVAKHNRSKFNLVWDKATRLGI